MTKVFIDGSAGTTGLRIHDRLASRSDIELVTIPEDMRKDPSVRKEAMDSSDIVFLCLPDAAAAEAAALAGPHTKIIDTSTAHRTDPDWTYGFPELFGMRKKISDSSRIANPGCHASGFIALVSPLVRAGIIPSNLMLTAYSLTGYSGGGKKMIAEYEAGDRDPLFDAPRQYATGQNHKHLPEMVRMCGLENAPVFCPVVSDYYSGMQVTVPLFKSWIKGTSQDIEDLYRSIYKGPVIHFDKTGEQMLSAGMKAGFDDMSVTVLGNDERILLISSFDNLGKGASGAAIQNMNIILGLPETTGLHLSGDNTNANH